MINHKSTPVQYQQGWTEFYKLRFKVSPDVLIPRPETELLVDEVLNSIKYYVPGIKDITVIDLGTGSGNIAIAIAKNAPNMNCSLACYGVSLWASSSANHLFPAKSDLATYSGSRIKIIATDISSKALGLAAQNAKLHGVEDKITWVQSDLLNFPKPSSPLILNTGYLILVTNLPYIPSARIPYLDSSVKDFEPLLALDGGEDGFDLYRQLFQQISRQPGRLLPKLVIGEIDYTHGELAQAEVKKFFPKAEVEVKTDLTKKQRILLIKF